MIKIDIYKKNKIYERVNTISKSGIDVVCDFCNYYERRLKGEKIKIKYHYYYKEKMDIDVYFSNGYKYAYYNIPCYGGAIIDEYRTIKEI